MKALKLDRTDLYLLGVLIALSLLVAILSSWVIPPEKKGSFFEQPSSHFNRAYGTKALYLSLLEMGADVRRLERSIDDFSLAEIDSLLVLEPWKSLAEDEQESLREWVRAGNRLLYIPRDFTWEIEDEESTEEREGAEPEGEWLSHPRDHGLREVRVDGGEEIDPLFENVSSIWVQSASTERSDPCEDWLLEGGECRTILSEGEVPLAIRTQLGEGEILWLADSFPLSNLGMKEDAHVFLVANLIRDLTGGDPERTVAFDEFHHGFIDRDTSAVAILKMTFGDWWGYAIANALLVGALSMWVASKRFGKPLDVQLEQRRHQTEFVHAAANLLRRGKGTAQVGETLASYYKERFRNFLHLPPTADSVEIDREVDRHVMMRVDEALGILESRTESGKVHENQIVAACQILEKALERLNHGFGKHT